MSNKRKMTNVPNSIVDLDNFKITTYEENVEALREDTRKALEYFNEIEKHNVNGVYTNPNIVEQEIEIEIEVNIE